MREEQDKSKQTPPGEEKDEIGEILNEVRQRQARESGQVPTVQAEEGAQPAPQDALQSAPADVEPQPAQPSAVSAQPVQNFATPEHEENLYPEEKPMRLNQKKKIIILCVSLVVVAAVVVGAIFGLRALREPETTAPTVSDTQPSTEAEPAIVNPLTGEEGYNADAVGKRPVACVIENSRAARPQWGITTPDMIVEGEVEGGETRMLWFYSDFTSLPDQIGPVRSARPSFVKFSELFDAVFVHWGGSHTRENYTGGYETIEADNVDHLDGISGNGAFGRDRSRGGAVEHSGVLYGDKLVSALDSKSIRTDLDTAEYSQFAFREKAEAVGTETCSTLTVKISSNCAENKVLRYDTDSARYINTGSYGTQVSFKNVLVLSMDTTYKTVAYKSSTETYLDYDVSGSGTGSYASEGTITSIKWSIEDGQLKLTDAQGAELQLNPGDIYLALISTNHGGQVTAE